MNKKMLICLPLCALLFSACQMKNGNQEGAVLKGEITTDPEEIPELAVGVPFDLVCDYEYQPGDIIRTDYMIFEYTVGDSSLLKAEKDNLDPSHVILEGLEEGDTTLHISYANLSLDLDVTIVEAVEPEDIELDVDELSIDIDEGYGLEAYIYPDDATDQSVTWESSDPEVATVEDGYVTAISYGSCTITATTCNGLEATCEVTVEKQIAVTEISLDATSLNLRLGDEPTQINATVSPDDASDPSLVWSSDNEDVVTVEEGLITVVGEGDAVVTATSVSTPEISATCNVHVGAAGSIVLNVESLDVTIGGTGNVFVISYEPAGKNIKWTVEDDSIAYASEGSNTGVTVSGVSIGETTLTASIIGMQTVSASVSISVTEAPIVYTGTIGQTTKEFVKDETYKPGPSDQILAKYHATFDSIAANDLITFNVKEGFGYGPSGNDTGNHIYNNVKSTTTELTTQYNVLKTATNVEVWLEEWNDGFSFWIPGGDHSPSETGMYLVGSFSNWICNTDAMKGIGKNSDSEYFVTNTFAQGTEAKFVWFNADTMTTYWKQKSDDSGSSTSDADYTAEGNFKFKATKKFTCYCQPYEEPLAKFWVIEGEDR